MNDLQVSVIIGSVISSTISGVWVNAMLNSRIGTIISISLASLVFLGLLITLPWYMCETYKLCNGFIF